MVPTPQKIVAELWRRGDIGQLLYHDGQRKIDKVFRGAVGALIVFLISRQWGKTFYGVSIANEVAVKNPRARVRIAAALETDLTEFIEPAFEKLFESCPEHLTPRYLRHKKTYIYPNGSSIKLVGLDKKPNGLRGNTIDLIVLDEAGFVSRLDYLYYSVFVPLITHRPNAKILVMTTPPESPDHELWKFVDRAKIEKSFATFTIDENPLLSKEDITRIEREMGGRDATAFQREYLCKRVLEEDKALVPEWRDEYVQEFDPQSDPLYQFWHKYEFMDIGIQRDKTVILFAYYNFLERRLYVLDELDISGVKTTTRLIHDRLREKEAELKFKFKETPKDKEFIDRVHRRIADNSHPLLLNDLGSKGTHFHATDKAKLHEMIGELRVWVRAGRIWVHPRCVQLVGCFSAGVWNKQRLQFEHSKLFGHYDALAAAVYGVRNTNQNTNPLPEDLGRTADSSLWIPPSFRKPRLSELGQDMVGLLGKRKGNK